MNLLIYVLFIWMAVIPAAVVGAAMFGAHRRERGSRAWAPEYAARLDRRTRRAASRGPTSSSCPDSGH
jgi:hypothetical protein